MWIQKTPTQLSKNQDTGRRRKVRNLTLTNIALRPTDRHFKGEAQIEGELNLASTKSVLGALWIAEGGKRWQKAAKLERDGDSDRGRSITGSERASNLVWALTWQSWGLPRMLDPSPFWRSFRSVWLTSIANFLPQMEMELRTYNPFLFQAHFHSFLPSLTIRLKGTVVWQNSEASKYLIQ